MFYFVANIKIVDETEYQKYLAKVDEVFSKYNGKYLAVDQTPRVLEGEWNYSRVIIISFENEDDFNNWYNSVDYQDIIQFRLNGSKCDTILIKGN